MRIFFRQNFLSTNSVEEDYTPVNLRDSMEKTRKALEIAYAGFDNAIEAELIDSYIYEINSLQKRYEHLSLLAASEPDEPEYIHRPSPIRSFVDHVFG